MSMTCQEALWKVDKDSRYRLFDDRADAIADAIDELLNITYAMEEEAKASYPMNDIPEELASDIDAARAMLGSAQRLLTKLFIDFCKREKQRP